MLDFKYVTPFDKAVFEKYTYSCREKNCDFAFANVYCWSSFYHTEICEYGGFLIIRFRTDGKGKIGYAEPVGSGDFENVINEIIRDAQANGQPLRMQSLSSMFAERIATLECYKEFFVYSNRDFSDYIYSADSLRSLSGKKLQSKRNHINQFRRQYEYRYEPLAATHKNEVFMLLHKWQAAKHTDMRNFAVEADVIRCGMEHFDELSLIGGALYVDGHMVAFTYGSAINDETFCVHIEKADIDFESSFPMINQLFINSLPEKYLYINREEDLGLTGLRESKLSYHPLALYKKWYLLDKKNSEVEMFSLFEQGFGDSSEFIVEYLCRWRPKGRSFVRRAGEKIVSAADLHRFRGNIITSGYIYGVVTEINFRRRGLSESIMREIFNWLYHQGESLAMLIAADLSLSEWYITLGFSHHADQPAELYADGNFDFGTGNAENNMLQYRIINVLKYLTIYASEYPDKEAFTVAVADDLLPFNDGLYRVEKGRVEMQQNNSQDYITVTQLFDSYPLAETKYIYDHFSV
ncbi:MAG: GNAT family N-acetyltransferase [Bacteroidales bacterium]